MGDVFRTFTTHLKTRLSSLTEFGEKYGLSGLLNDITTDAEPLSSDGDLDLDDLSSFFEKTTSGLVQNVLAGLTEEEPPVEPPIIEVSEAPEEVTIGSPPKAEAASAPAQTNGKIDFMTDYKELEALVAESTSNYVKTTLHGLSPVPYQPTVPTSTSKLPPQYPCYR